MEIKLIFENSTVVFKAEDITLNDLDSIDIEVDNINDDEAEKLLSNVSRKCDIYIDGDEFATSVHVSDIAPILQVVNRVRFTTTTQP